MTTDAKELIAFILLKHKDFKLGTYKLLPGSTNHDGVGRLEIYDRIKKAGNLNWPLPRLEIVLSELKIEGVICLSPRGGLKMNMDWDELDHKFGKYKSKELKINQPYTSPRFNTKAIQKIK